MKRLVPETDGGRALLLGLLLISAGLAIGLPPLALWGPGAALFVPGLILTILAFMPTPEAES